MVELTEELARKLDRASKILTGLARVASKDCIWLRHNQDLHAEILELQNELRATAARVTGNSDMGTHFVEAQKVGNQLRELFQPGSTPES